MKLFLESQALGPWRAIINRGGAGISPEWFPVYQHVLWYRDFFPGNPLTIIQLLKHTKHTVHTALHIMFIINSSWISFHVSTYNVYFILQHSTIRMSGNSNKSIMMDTGVSSLVLFVWLFCHTSVTVNILLNISVYIQNTVF